MKKYNVAIVGATGAVGEEMRLVLEERKFPVEKLSLFASGRSAGRVYEFNGEKITVRELKDDSFSGINIALFSAGDEVSAHYAPLAVQIANPNCSTIQMVVALKPIYDEAGIERVIVATYQSVSGTGKEAIEELKTQAASIAKGEEFEIKAYPYQIAYNALPHIGSFKENGYTSEEMKMLKK
jgi:aspartate-semialdehyde dehydrogenase